MSVSRKPAPDYKSSLLLSDEQNDVICRLLSSRCQSLATAVTQVLFSDVTSGSRWTKRHVGVACFVRDSQRRSYFIRVLCPDRQIAVWEQELYNGFSYKAPRAYFHSFEGDECMVGLNFADEEEALRFQNAVEGYLRKKIERRERKRQVSTAIQVKPLATRSDNNNFINGNSTPANFTSRIEVPKQDNHKYNKKGKKEKGGKLRKEDIGAPTNFQHVQHVGWDANRGFALENVDEQLKPFFKMAGITEDHLTDRETRDFIYEFISQHGGVEAAMLEISKPPPPPVPARGPATPQVNRSAPPPPIRTQAPPPPARGVHVRPAPKVGGGAPVSSAPAAPPLAIAMPPPPPPLPPGGLIIGSAPPPPPMMGMSATPQAKPSILPPAAQTDTRSALMDAIKGGAALKKVDTSVRKSSVSDSRGDLLDQIRSGVELKAVAASEAASKSGGTDGLANALARALADRSRVLQSDSDNSGSGSDSGEDEDDWD